MYRSFFFNLLKDIYGSVNHKYFWKCFFSVLSKRFLQNVPSWTIPRFLATVRYILLLSWFYWKSKLGKWHWLFPLVPSDQLNQPFDGYKKYTAPVKCVAELPVKCVAELSVKCFSELPVKCLAKLTNKDSDFLHFCKYVNFKIYIFFYNCLWDFEWVVKYASKCF